jgi:magnesium-transporting ATPase (P-type)
VISSNLVLAGLRLGLKNRQVVTVLVALNNPSVKVVVKRYFDMFLRFVVLFVFIIAVYTSAFAKRFGMPQEWVDDELKGAEALAYRLDLDVYDMFLRFVVLFVFIIAVGLIFLNYNFPIIIQFLQVFFQN